MAQVWDISADPEAAIDAAAAAVQAGECIVLPTDTVYGIGADASNPKAVQRLLDAKERGRDMPPPILVAEVAMLPALTDELTPEMISLAEAFWPGALTLIVRAHAHLRMDLGDRGETIAVRVPDHEFTRELLRATGPIAVSSANVSGRPAAMTVAEAEQQLGDRVALYLDGGPAGPGAPSTIVDLTGPPRVVRQGRLAHAELAGVLGGLEPVQRAEPDSGSDPERESDPKTAADQPATQVAFEQTETPDPASPDQG